MEKRRLRSNLVALCNSLKENGEGDDNYYFKLDVGSTYLSQMVKHWNRLSRELVDAPWLSLFKSDLDNALNNILFVNPVVVRQLNLMIL